MAEFPPNLDDGELYLPSDIFPEELSTNFGAPDVFPSELTYMEELAQQLSSFTLLDRASVQPAPPKPPFTTYLEFRPVHPPQTGFGALATADRGHQDLGFFVNGGFCASSRPVYQFFPVKPAPAEVERFLQGRGCVLRRQPNQSPKRFLPFRVSGSGRTGLAKESCGTGVFLPRVFSADTRKKNSVRNAEQEHPTRNVSMAKQDMAFHHPSEKALPQDWTY